MYLSVVIPAYNEDLGIGRTLRAIHTSLQRQLGSRVREVPIVWHHSPQTRARVAGLRLDDRRCIAHPLERPLGAIRPASSDGHARLLSCLKRIGAG